MRKALFYILLTAGILFFVNAVFGRYIVLPGYFESMESGIAKARDFPDAIPAWKIVRYMIWAFSFKLGALLVLAAFLVRNSFSVGRIWIVIGAGLVYIATAYMDIPNPASIFFGIGGSIITIAACIVFALYSREYGKKKQPGAEQLPSDSVARLIELSAFFMFAMASYNLCPLLGVKTFALQPEKMIKYGMQSEAASFAAHVMIELCAGWILLVISRLYSRFRKHNQRG